MPRERGGHALATRTAEPEPAVEQEGVRARVFDADRTDRLLPFDDALKARISARQLLWIDIVGELTPEQRGALAERFELESDTEGALGAQRSGPSLELHGQHFHYQPKEAVVQQHYQQMGMPPPPPPHGEAKGKGQGQGHGHGQQKHEEREK